MVYDPRIVILHYEFASSKKKEDAIELQVRNCQKFVGTHEKWLKRDTNLGLPNPLPKEIFQVVSYGFYFLKIKFQTPAPRFWIY